MAIADSSALQYLKCTVVPVTATLSKTERNFWIRRFERFFFIVVPKSRLITNACMTNCAFILCDMVKLPSVPESNQSEAMYDMIVSISQAHLAHCAYTQEKTLGLVRKPALFQGITDQQGAGVQKVVLWQQFASLLSPSIPHVVEFAKRIPSFQDLLQDDQLLCIKLGFFEVWLVHAAHLSGESSLTFADGTCVSRHHMEIMFDREFVSLIFNFVDYFNGLHLSDNIIALYSAVVLVSAERDGIFGHKALQQLQDQLLEALRQQVTDERPAEPHLFPNLVSKLPELHLLGLQHLDHLRWFRANWMHLRLSPLFAEVFDIPRPDSSQR
ncbi:ecdysone-induced protein 78C [Nephila pilipes]|uniref:Ecdysone-induced protein 78C n=1 Tax=Nephila pilipes TaxID=299642 RepID=A0A8X6P868_NEPPI|nr:ecdysone-induced protein 78C [Nephila pilipes]